MSSELAPHDSIWLHELQRRIIAGLPLDTRVMMVELRDSLPAGFRPEMVNPRFLFNQGLSAEGLRAIGDPENLLADVERGIQLIRQRLIEYPSLGQVSAGEVAEHLDISAPRAESLLSLVSSLGPFSAGGSASDHGYSNLSLAGRIDVLAEYLAFSTIENLLERRSESHSSAKERPVVRPRQQSHPASLPSTVFILMSMDPKDDSLADVHNAIRSECAAFNLDATRIDDLEHQDRITDQILERIATSEFIVADLSGEKPNVYYEVGFAHAIGKRPILLRKRGTRLHFDLLVHNVPEYRNITELRTTLRRRLQAILGRSPRESQTT